MTEIRAGQASDPGRVRSSNQDLALVAGNLVAVADGMGGHAGGEVAARLAIDTLREGFSANPSAEGLVHAGVLANDAVLERAEADEGLRGMGTTLTAAAVVNDGGPERLAVINVGDSRAYLLEAGHLEQITSDHSLVEEMVRRGEITAEQALVHPQRHILTRALGIEPGVEIDSWQLPLEHDRRVLLCSDGLTNECSETEIAEVLEQSADPQDAAEELVARALSHGGGDNITVVVLDVDLDGETAHAGAIGAIEELRAPDQLPISGEKTDGLTTTASVRVSPAAPRQPRPRPARPARPPVSRAEARIMTPRVAIFVIVFIALLGGIIGFTLWFNNASYYVGLSHGDVAIFEGRPGGLLWFKPTVVEQTNISAQNILQANLPELRSGILESSFDGAKSVTENLANEKGLLGIGAAPPSTSPNPTATASSLPTATTVVVTATTSTPTTSIAPTTTVKKR